MAKNWNELQDEGPLEVRVKRLTAAPDQPAPSRSPSLRFMDIEARLDELESKWKFSAGRVAAFILVLLVGPTVLTLFVLWLLNQIVPGIWA